MHLFVACLSIAVQRADLPSPSAVSASFFVLVVMLRLRPVLPFVYLVLIGCCYTPPPHLPHHFYLDWCCVASTAPTTVSRRLADRLPTYRYLPTHDIDPNPVICWLLLITTTTRRYPYRTHTHPLATATSGPPVPLPLPFSFRLWLLLVSALWCIRIRTLTECYISYKKKWKEDKYVV
jgi:hypothetical protein